MTLELGVSAVTISMRNYLSTHMLWGAGHMVALAKDAEDTEPASFSVRHRSYVISAILLSVNFMEAAINELLQDCYDDKATEWLKPLGTRVVGGLSAYWDETEARGSSGGSVLAKYQTVLAIAGLATLPRGEQPYQDAALLIRLRNELVHFKPETVALGPGADKKLAVALRPKFPSNALMAGTGNPYLFDHCLGAGCASWAVASCRALADEVFSRLAVAPNYQRAGFQPPHPWRVQAATHDGEGGGDQATPPGPVPTT